MFDPSRLGPEIGASALVYAPVQYGSPEDRLAWIEKLAVRVAGLARQSGLPDDKVYLAAHATFERLKLFALFSKHRGFAEEREWRIVYLPERDGGKKLRPRFNYLNGARGVEPKLRFKVEPIDGLTPPDLSLDKLIDSILLGPSTSSPLAHRSVERMLEVIGMPQLKDRLFASTIPFRAL